MSPHGCTDGRLAAGYTSTDHQHLLAFFRRGQIVFVLHAGQGIHQAAHTASFPVFPGAALKASDAVNDFFFPAFLDFFRQFRVRQGRPCHGHQIRFAGLEDAFRQVNIVDPAHGNHRDVHHAFNFRCVVYVGSVRDDGGRNDGLGGGIHPLGAVDAVGACLFHQTGQHLGFFDSQPAMNVFHCRHPVQHRKITAALLLDVMDNLHGKTGTVADGASVFVAALVGKGGGKGAHQIAVSAVDLYSIESCFFGSSGAVTEQLHQFMDFLHRQFPRGFRHGGLPQWGRGHRLHTGDGAAGFPAGVVDLSHNLASGGMDPPGQLPVSRDLAVLPQTGQADKSPYLGCNDIIFGDNQSPAAFCLVLMVGQKFFGGGAVRVAVIGDHSGNHQAVFQF